MALSYTIITLAHLNPLNSKQTTSVTSLAMGLMTNTTLEDSGSHYSLAARTDEQNFRLFNSKPIEFNSIDSAIEACPAQNNNCLTILELDEKKQVIRLIDPESREATNVGQIKQAKAAGLKKKTAFQHVCFAVLMQHVSVTRCKLITHQDHQAYNNLSDVLALPIIRNGTIPEEDEAGAEAEASGSTYRCAIM